MESMINYASGVSDVAAPQAPTSTILPG